MIQYFVAQRNPGWGDQFKQACMLCPQVDEDDLIVSDVSLFEALLHFGCIGWKVLFAFIPPVEWGSGWPAFGVALTFIGVITAVVAEVATVLGCTLGLEEAVTAITLVAVGTSLPDTFASMTAAKQSEYADSAIGNVTGSNSVNVFVGLGLPWLISSIYQSNRNEKFLTPAGNLAFSVMLFLICSTICFMILGLRRAVSKPKYHFFVFHSQILFIDIRRRVGRATRNKIPIRLHMRHAVAHLRVFLFASRIRGNRGNLKIYRNREQV